MSDVDDEGLVDEEILEIFVEEAEEVLETINEFFPKWQENPEDTDSRTEVRRAFHTLKGSGRMVKASIISELAWSVENMLNRIIDGAVPLHDGMFNLINRVRMNVPDLLEAFKNQTQPQIDVQFMMQEADAYAAGETIAEAAASTPAAEKATPLTTDEEELSEEEMKEINDRMDKFAISIESLIKAIKTVQDEVATLKKSQSEGASSSADITKVAAALQATNKEVKDLKFFIKSSADKQSADAGKLKSIVTDEVSKASKDSNKSLQSVKTEVGQVNASIQSVAGLTKAALGLSVVSLVVAGAAIFLALS